MSRHAWKWILFVIISTYSLAMATAVGQSQKRIVQLQDSVHIQVDTVEIPLTMRSEAFRLSCTYHPRRETDGDREAD